MKMLTRAFNNMRDLTEWVNEKAISKEQIVNLFKAEDKTYLLVYYAEE